MDVYELSKKLESKGFKVFYTNTIAETRGLLTELIGRTDTVGAGGSATLDEIGIGEALKERGNTVYIRRLMPDVNPDEVMKKAVFADWFLTSTNALTEDGEFVNVDGNCNRIASMLYGGKNTVFVLGVNKIVKDVPAALERIRTVAAKKNCLRFGYLSNILVEAKVDYNNPMNLLLTSIVMGIGVSTASLTIGTVSFKGMSLATVVAIILSLAFRLIAMVRGDKTPLVGQKAEDSTHQ